MKKYLILFLLLAIAAPAMAQHDGQRPDKKKRAEITELVGDLSAPQKRKIENISKDSKTRVDDLRRQQQAVRDSIRLYMDLDGDQSRHLYPLFDRESQLQVAVSREMYTAKLRIDEVLTAEQRAELRKSHRKKK